MNNNAQKVWFREYNLGSGLNSIDFYYPLPL